MENRAVGKLFLLEVMKGMDPFTGVVTFIRSGNEKSVKHVKYSKLIVRGAEG